MWGSLHTFGHVRGLKFGTQVSKDSYVMMIHDLNDDHIVQVPGHEPSMASNIEFQDEGFFKHF